MKYTWLGWLLAHSRFTVHIMYIQDATTNTCSLTSSHLLVVFPSTRVLLRQSVVWQGYALQNKCIWVKLPLVYHCYWLKLEFVKINVLLVICKGQLHRGSPGEGRWQGECVCSAQGPNVFQQLWFEEGGALSTCSRNIRLHSCIPGKCEKSCRDLKKTIQAQFNCSKLEIII